MTGKHPAYLCAVIVSNETVKQAFSRSDLSLAPAQHAAEQHRRASPHSTPSFPSALLMEATPV